MKEDFGYVEKNTFIFYLQFYEVYIEKVGTLK